MLHLDIFVFIGSKILEDIATDHMLSKITQSLIYQKEQCWVGLQLQLLGADRSTHIDASMQIKFKN